MTCRREQRDEELRKERYLDDESRMIDLLLVRETRTRANVAAMLTSLRVRCIRLRFHRDPERLLPLLRTTRGRVIVEAGMLQDGRGLEELIVGRVERRGVSEGGRDWDREAGLHSHFEELGEDSISGATIQHWMKH
jgi:hypothetical protein